MRLLLFAAVWLLAVAAAQADEPAKTSFAQQRADCHSAHAGALKELADSCDSQGLSAQAAFTRRWLPTRDPLMIYVFALPESSAAPATLVESTGAQKWWIRFGNLRREQAAKLVALARQAATARQPELALELVREAVREDPDHEGGRAALGFQRLQDRWVTADAARRLKAGKQWSEAYGWLPAEHVSRYEQGQRYDRGNWVSAEEDAKRRQHIRDGWRIETEHFTVTTNHSLEEGVRLAKLLETLYEVWGQAFVRYRASPEQVQKWFEPNYNAAVSTPAVRRHQVVYFRDKAQYVAELGRAQPGLETSLGVYRDNSKTAYFFAGDEQYDGTLFHEATHQLFRETRAGDGPLAKKDNCWVVEGIACYMESLTAHRLADGLDYEMYYTIGGANAGRAPAARQRVVEAGFYVPLRELVTLGVDELQHEPRMRPIYSQCAGLALFFMHADGGRYRPALIDYLTAIYSGRANPSTLEKLSGAKYEELDQQYRAFIQ